MIKGWVLVYFIIFGTTTSPAVAPQPQQLSGMYSSQTECQMHADAVNKASGEHLRAECQAVAE